MPFPSILRTPPAAMAALKGVGTAVVPALLIASIMIGPTPALAQDAGVLRHITVTGTGSVATVPDMATIRTGIEVIEPTAGDALASVGVVSNALLALVLDAGVAPEDVQTSGLSVRPEYRETRGTQPAEVRIVGFNASVSLSVAVRDLDNLGTLMDRLVSDAGANRLGGISFGLSDPQSARDAARRAAVADALATATLLAEAAGVGLGDVISITDGARAADFPMPLMAQAEMARGIAIAPGSLDISADVTLVIGLVDAP